MRLSIVSTLYNSATFVAEFCGRAAESAKRLTPDYEIILVNDGSPDASLAAALTARGENKRITVVDLSRNFGHHKAMMTGLARAKGDFVFLIDSDLEERPEWLAEFKAEMDRAKADVVYGVQAKRRGGWFERFTGWLYYATFEAVTSLPLPRNLLTVRLMTRRYVQALVAHQERELNIGALWAYSGFVQAPLPVDKGFKGSSTYGVRAKITHFVNSVTSFSSAPLVFVFYLGVSISALAGVAGTYLIIRRLFFGVLMEGWPSLIVSVWFLGGLTLLSLGVLGVYLAKVFTEVKQRPYTVVREVFEGDK